MTSWRHSNVTSWGRPRTVLYVTPWDVPYRRLEDVSCRRYEGTWIIVSIWIRKPIYISFIKNFTKFYLCFINVINIFNQNCLILQQNWLYIKRKNICHQQRKQKNVNLACFIAITTLSFLSNWSEKYYMKNRIFDESIVSLC